MQFLLYYLPHVICFQIYVMKENWFMLFDIVNKTRLTVIYILCMTYCVSFVIIKIVAFFILLNPLEQEKV